MAQVSRVETLGIEHGLSQGFIWGSCQDSQGFLWFGTKNGLNRYDGYEFVVFKNDAYDPHSLSDNQVIDVCDAGEFLCVMAYGQVNLFHRRSQRFYRLPKGAGIPSDFFEGGCETENDHTVWLFFILPNNGKQYFRLSWPPDLPAQLLRDTAAIGQVRVERMFGDLNLSSASLSADGKTLWLVTYSGQLGQKTLPDGPLVMTQVPMSNTRGLGLASAGNAGVLVGNFRQDTLAWYHPKAATAAPWTVWRALPKTSGLTTLNFDAAHSRLWTFSQSELREHDIGQPLHALERANARFVVPMPDGARNCLRDQNGILWFGTDAKGIRKFNPATRLFRHLLQGVSVYSRPVADQFGNIWLPDVRGGALNRVYSSRDGSSRPFPVAGLNLNLPTKIVNAADGTLWLCGQQSGGARSLLAHYDPASGKQETYTCPQPFDFWQCALFFDQNANTVWLADAQSLLGFDVRTQRFSTYPFENLKVGQANLFALEKTADGSIWVATDAGLIRAAPSAGGGYTFQLLKNNPSDRNSLLANNLKSLLTDPADGMVLWIGTAGNGLCRYDLRSHIFQHYRTQNGLPDDMVYGILAEDAGADGSINLWLSTNKGLARFNPRAGNFRYFLKYDGLQDDEFNTYAYGKMPSGELMFGGVNGLTIFDPKAISSTALLAEVRITGLKINNVAISPRDASGLLSESVEFTPPIVLPHDRNNLHIQFMATDLTQPTRNQFRYYLEGAEAEWAHTGFEHSAQYLNLPPGTYSFKVMAANSNGVWNPKTTTLNIRILPPWYASVWAYIAYVLLLATGIWSVYRYQLRQKLEHAENERLKELDTFKSRFFTNITHEFRTPLTVILGVTEKLRADRQAPNLLLDMIRRNGESLLRLINQILDLAKLESNKLELRPENGDLVAFVRYVAEAFHSFAEMRDLRVQFQANAEAFRMDFDAEKVQTVLSNLLSNALKFTPPGGKVTVDVQVDFAPESSDAAVFISVSDTGMGIPADKIGRIFERFYQADNSAARSGEGTGIGLALTRELVRLMRGDISVESQPGQGTTFTLKLPAVPQSGAATAPVPGRLAAPPLLQPEQTQQALPVSPADSSKPLLLLVEDNADVRQFLFDCTQEHYRVQTALNGRQGIDMAFEQVPDLIVSDVMMPEKDGFELCETLKNDPRTSHIPITLLTARVSVEDRIAGLQRGADAYLAKPFHQQELLLQLRNLLQLRRRFQERYANLEPTAPTDDPGLQIEDAFLQKFREHAEAQIGNAQLSVDDLCRAVGMGRTNLHQKITNLTGMSAMQYVRALRLRKAKQLLERGDLNVSEVAFEVGFDDPKYFGRVFAEEAGVPPTQWRKKA